MTIEAKKDYYGVDIVFTADNVKVTESLSETLYGKNEDGTKNFKDRLGADVTDGSMETFTRLLSDIVYYRSREFDGTDLALQLIEKMPEEKRSALFIQLQKDYDFEFQTEQK